MWLFLLVIKIIQFYRLYNFNNVSKKIYSTSLLADKILFAIVWK